MRTKFGNQKIEHNGRLFWKTKTHKLLNETFRCYWHCDDCTGTGTSNRVTENAPDEGFVEKKPHTCNPSIVNVINSKARLHFLDLVSNSANRNDAYQQTCQDLQDVNIVGDEYIALNGFMHFSTRVDLKSAVQRREAENQPVLPKTIQDLNLAGDSKRKYRKTRNGAQKNAVRLTMLVLFHINSFNPDGLPLRTPWLYK